MKSWDVMKAIAGIKGLKFSQRKNFLVIPNVSWGFLRYEADMLVVTKSKYCTEIEVKVSMSDWKADFDKRKHDWIDARIKYQYYAAPMTLAERYIELDLPQGWGVIGVKENGGIQILKEAISRSCRKINDKELMILCRLACFRVWRHENKILDDSGSS
jgi:hypothetical protein